MHARILTAAILAWLSGVANAADLTIGTRASPAIDPHFQWLGTNEAYSRHIFDALVHRTPEAKFIPGLAESWRQLDDTTWEFKLRRGVKFHDGSDFTAADVAFSIDRVATLPNNPNPYTANIKSISKVEAIDAHTVHIKSTALDPFLPLPLASIYIVSHKAAKGALPADFHSGRATIGTGPFKFVSYTPEDRLIVRRNPDYWGEKAIWDRVTFRIISNESTRVAALLAGDVDVIDFVPSTEVPTLEKNAKTAVHKAPSDRLIYLLGDVGRAPSPYVTDGEGKPLTPNPLQDIRVRRALAMAIDREAMVSRVVEGLAEPAHQMMPAGMVGFNPALPKIPHDIEGAKKLLAEAGYPNGFGMTVHCSNNRYVNDGKICQAVGQMLSRIGIKMRVETMPLNVFFPKIATPKSEFSFILVGWGNSGTGTASEFLGAILHSYDREKRRGHANRAYYSNPVYDRMVEDALTERDEAKRADKMTRAVTYITEQWVGIPLHVEYTVLASRREFTVAARRDQQTIAMDVRPAR
jgi:peptide/nickel transport system substrate-binding protein